VPKGAELRKALPVLIGITLAQSGLQNSDSKVAGRAPFLKACDLPMRAAQPTPVVPVGAQPPEGDAPAGPGRDVAKAKSLSHRWSLRAKYRRD
jgi:hypothetical protein